MDQQHLRTLLAQIQGELARAESLDAHNRELLRGVKDDLQRAVDSSETESEGGAPADAAPLPPEKQQERQGRLQRAMVALEGSHPQLASAIEQGMVALSNLGL